MKTCIVILAAGLGTRMKSKMAKVLHRAGGLTLVEHAVRAALQVAEAEDIVTVVGHQADAVKTVLAPYGVATALQREQRGTGHALSMAAGALQGSPGRLVVLYGDVPLLSPATVQRLVREYDASGKAAVVITCNLEDPSGYGRIVRGSKGEVAAIVEQKAATPEQLTIREINSGIYCFDATLLWKHIGEIGTNNPAGEYYLTDIVGIFNQRGYGVAPMLIEDSSELLGINTRVELARVDEIFRSRKTRELMLEEGVTIERPDTVTIDLDVKVGRDTVIESGVRLLGKTVVGEDCVIGAGSVLNNTVLAQKVLIGPYCSIGPANIGVGAEVGPFARLRQHNEVGPHAHIGNFVELKNTRLAARVKANHLAYLGDASIGANTNIGAGTITCNYDGVSKHKTQIGEDAFVGSNSTLVAPIEIGDRAYIGAGSTITDAVPSHSLALGRARQAIKPGWKMKSEAK
jgi:bifunctional UDP-N-acetylglucosamine pyrophosphorylase / glucosamine-1-phosphate N-acetyltransferase